MPGPTFPCVVHPAFQTWAPVGVGFSAWTGIDPGYFDVCGEAIAKFSWDSSTVTWDSSSLTMDSE